MKKKKMKNNEKSKKKINKYLKEFIDRAPYDGVILYSFDSTKDEIIKLKPPDLLTVDLRYDGNDIFLDANDNCYFFDRGGGRKTKI